MGKIINFLLIALGVVLTLTLLGMAVWFFGYAATVVAYNQEVETYNKAQLALAVSFNPPPTEVIAQLPSQNQPVMIRPAGSTTSVPAIVAAPTPTVAGKPSPTPTPVLPKVVRLTVPRIKIDREVEPVGLTRDPECVKKNGEAKCLPYNDTPESNIGWHNDSGLPGQNRTIEFNAHIQWYKNPGAFRYLANVAVNDEVVLTTADNVAHKYAVRQILYFPWDTDEGSNYLKELEKRGEELVVMITCATWSPEKQIYVNRLLVVAVPSPK